jgi:hypothetical protein
MTACLELIHQLAKTGITISLSGEHVVAKPTPKVTPAVVAQIRGVKPQLIQVLSGPINVCDRCEGPVVRDRTFDGYWNRICARCGCWHRGLRPDGSLAGDDPAHDNGTDSGDSLPVPEGPDSTSSAHGRPNNGDRVFGTTRPEAQPHVSANQAAGKVPTATMLF